MRAIDAGILVCGDCHQLNRQDPAVEEQHCRRCGAVPHARQPDSLRRTWALLLTATILYIPANVLDIMTINTMHTVPVKAISITTATRSMAAPCL